MLAGSQPRPACRRDRRAADPHRAPRCAPSPRSRTSAPATVQSRSPTAPLCPTADCSWPPAATRVPSREPAPRRSPKRSPRCTAPGMSMCAPACAWNTSSAGGDAEALDLTAVTRRESRITGVVRGQPPGRLPPPADADRRARPGLHRDASAHGTAPANAPGHRTQPSRSPSRPALRTTARILSDASGPRKLPGPVRDRAMRSSSPTTARTPSAQLSSKPQLFPVHAVLIGTHAALLRTGYAHATWVRRTGRSSSRAGPAVLEAGPGEAEAPSPSASQAGHHPGPISSSASSRVSVRAPALVSMGEAPACSSTFGGVSVTPVGSSQ